MNSKTQPDPALQRLLDGDHDDPFAVLGPHEIDGLRHVTCFDPGAHEMAAVVAGVRHPLDPVPGAPGVFRGPVPGDLEYHLRGSANGHVWEMEDPYRFGPVLGDLDEYLLGEGSHLRMWEVMGAHPRSHDGVFGTHFAVWAPNARRVSVVGDFNGWDGRRHPMRRRGATGVWEMFLPGVAEGAFYRYEIKGPDGRIQPRKADPFGFGSEHPPANASIVRDITGYGWSDDDWMTSRAAAHDPKAPISIYEVHLPSWRRKDWGRPISYVEAAEELVAYVRDMGFTHI
ncbi:MAG TPA: 1,4-alpha-glucan branching enzyme, partial [Citreicella sp.]|nr:1,4-alpha-glucan branching enzyme [Citreicella sp.]